MIKLIASDLDGTLLQNGAMELKPEIFDTIIKLKENGILFVAASGRPLSNLQHLFAPIKDDIAYIAENGTLCVYHDELISENHFDSALASEILADVKTQPGSEFLLASRHISYVENSNDSYVRLIRDIMKYHIQAVDDITTVQDDFLKIAVYNQKGSETIVNYYKQKYGDRLDVVTSGNLWVDMISKDINKGYALGVLLSHLNISPADSMAFGDQYNDVEMLQLAGTSYAMSNAAPGIAYHSTYVTDSVEEVLMDLIL
ncbi:MAG: HAD family hydrolase [Lachnospiraceae bacterium]